MSKVRLYIAGNEVDFGDGDNLLLFTYSAADLDAPAVVQNSYSKEITLPPTKRNAAVFGALWRADKVASGTDGFDALAREPFEIRNHAGELLESGYVKLSSASARDGYTLVLYGGLGAFLYGLMYNSDGTKKTLADLSWGDTLDAGLSFNINASIVGAAWSRLDDTMGGAMPLASPYDIINFAPMHNGIPSDFDANKGLIPVGTDYGCETHGTETGVTIDGIEYALVTFGREFDEWEVRDLRSYLQRPVFRIKALLSALEDSNQNGGYAFDWSAVAALPDLAAWMTLPMLHTEEITEGRTTLTLAWGTNPVTDTQLKSGVVIPLTTTEVVPSVGKITLSIGVKMSIAHALTTYDTSLWNGSHGLCIYARLIGYDSGNNPIVYGPMRELAYADNTMTRQAAPLHLGGYTGKTADGIIHNSVFGDFNPNNVELQVQGGTLARNGYGTSIPDTIGVTLEGYNVDHFALAVGMVAGEKAMGHIAWGDAPAVPFGTSVNGAAAVTSATMDDTYASVTTENTNRVRTGAYISKKALLGGSSSPAEILLSLVKTFGFVLAYDGLNRRVRLLNRGDFYAGDEVDITERIDRNQPYVVEPNGINEKWLRFALGNPEGAFAEYYRNKYGLEYGEMRADTGSPFNAEMLGVLEGVKFVEGVTGLAYSRYYYLVYDPAVGDDLLPSPYLDNNCKYVVWNTDGSAEEYDVPSITNNVSISGICTLDAALVGYDTDLRLQLAGEDNAQAQDGAGILLLYDGVTPDYHNHLTDDSAGMLNRNNGTPCWMPCLRGGTLYALYEPRFLSVDLASFATGVERALNIARPQELDGYDYSYGEGVDIYSRRWRAYIADRYNQNAHRVTCYVDWGGIRVEQALLGKFFWFDGCWWVLDKIEDYCWDNPQPCKCTFVRVLDKTAYTNGQS